MRFIRILLLNSQCANTVKTLNTGPANSGLLALPAQMLWPGELHRLFHYKDPQFTGPPNTGLLDIPAHYCCPQGHFTL